MAVNKINEPEISWLQDGEKAEQSILNRPLKQFLAKFNTAVDEINSDISDVSGAVSGTVPITRGGTGATDAAGARTALGTNNAANLTTGTVPVARIPNIDASKTTSGVFNVARIPNLDASKITSGTLDISLFPELPNAGGMTDGFHKPVEREPLFVKVSPNSFKIPAGTSVQVNGTNVEYASDLTLTIPGGTPQGTDLFVYIRETGTAYISTDEDELQGRLIGGLHYSLVPHTEAQSGNKTESDMVKLRGINAYSFWDLKYRAAKSTNRGLAKVGNKWVDIYLADENYAIRGYSAPGGWIAGGVQSSGRKFPKIPEIYGGDGSATYGKLTPFVSMDMAHAAGMQRIPYEKFTKLAYGVQEGLNASTLESTIGKVEHYPQLMSKYGIEQATGTQYIWGADFGSSSSGSWQNVADGRGQVYSGVVNVLLGSTRGHTSGYPGSRCSDWRPGLSLSAWNIGLRCLCDHSEPAL